MSNVVHLAVFDINRDPNNGDGIIIAVGSSYDDIDLETKSRFVSAARTFEVNDPAVGDAWLSGTVVKDHLWDMESIRQAFGDVVEAEYERATNLMDTNPSETRKLEYAEKRMAAYEVLDTTVAPPIRVAAIQAINVMITDSNRDDVNSRAAGKGVEPHVIIAEDIMEAATLKRALLFTAGDFRGKAAARIAAETAYLGLIGLLDDLRVELQAAILAFIESQKPKATETTEVNNGDTK